MNTWVQMKQAPLSQNIRLIDMGGHQEYYACSSLFFSTSGVFLVCFDSLLLNTIWLRLLWSSWDFLQVQMKMKIVLVATKQENIEESKLSEISCTKLLEITKCQLTSAKSGLFLLNEVALISSNKVTRVILEDIRTKVARICSEVKLKAETEEMQPFSWHKFLDVAGLNPHMSLTHARRALRVCQGPLGEREKKVRKQPT